MDQHIQAAYVEQLPVRVVLLHRKRTGTGASRAEHRALDPVPWAITNYDWSTGEATVVRGASPVRGPAQQMDEELGAFEEGRQRRLFVLHRQRESRLRLEKLAEAREANGGRLVCEVPNCGFDFREQYGALGDGFAHVHHLIPLAQAPADGYNVRLSELAVVCANCHAMIHRGGQCRPLEGLIPA
jgi:5-methylcytosine-specific restriction protein A